MQQMVKQEDRGIDRSFLGGHPAITASGTLAKGRMYQAGEVLGQVTTNRKLKGLDPGASDGTQEAMAILADDVDASATDEPCVIVVHGDGIAAGLIWPDGITEQQKTGAVAALQAKGIYVK